MVYDVYFHNDFDGHASAAVFLAYLKTKGDRARFFPIDHDIRSKWKAMKFKNPAVIFDFYFHPKATFWIDHHETTFKFPEWKKKYRKTKYHQFDPKYYSCCHLVYDVLRRDFGFKPPAHFKELVKWLDVIDAARYESAQQEIEMKAPAIQIGHFIDTARGKKKLAWLVELLADRSIKKIVKDKRIQNGIESALAKRKKCLDFYKRKLQIHGRVAFIDLSKSSFHQIDVAPFYLVPDLVYSVTLKKRGKVYSFSLRVNPWRRKEAKIHLGNLLMENCGGGGHPGAAGCELKSGSDVDVLSQKLVEFLGQSVKGRK